ncbi:ATP-binding protein [Streptomyces sp. NPDC046976]|uniref:ATP-binding protein n=1 Tax=Streptomyces sp. NPDC046976 TaxID=3155258 RepID=UPI0033C43BAE
MVIPGRPPVDAAHAASDDVVWRELRPVPPCGIRTPPRAVEPAYVLGMRASWELPGRDERTPAVAREHVREVLRVWRARSVSADVELIVSELTTNAVVHACGTVVRLTVVYDGARVWILVTDEGPRRPLQHDHVPGDDDESGRGLYLVGALAHLYGTVPDGDGTRVWACVEVPPREPRGS